MSTEYLTTVKIYVSIIGILSEIGRGVAGISGQFSITSTVKLGDGAHSFTAISVDTAGNTSVNSLSF